MYRRKPLLVALLSLASTALITQGVFDATAAADPAASPSPESMAVTETPLDTTAEPATITSRREGAHRAPRTWDAEALEDWALPVAAIGVKPGNHSVEEYYAAPIDNLRTYPVYHPDAEPDGYWQKLQRTEPQPLVEDLGIARTDEEWIELGERVFEELDVKGFRRNDADSIAQVRSREELDAAKVKVGNSGVIHGLRWVPTDQGLMLGVSDCSGCHTHFMEDGTEVDGAPFDEPIDNIVARHIGDGMDYFFPGDDLAMQHWRIFAVPWIEDDPNDAIRDMSPGELFALRRSNPAGTFARTNGSPFYPNKVPDLIGIEDYHWIDGSATHRHRGPGDFMRYAAKVAYEEPMTFGDYEFYTDAQRPIRYRLPDDTLYAMARYVYSLEPPPNPHPFDARAEAGEKIFEREGCVHCHTPPLYTNNELTPAKGFKPPAEHYERYAITPRSVGTDPGLAMRTRKGTGYYRIPSLRGVWYRTRLLHDGSVSTLEELFDSARLEEDYVPSGFKGLGVTHRAVEGHEFGLDLSASERTQLIAFLRTL